MPDGIPLFKKDGTIYKGDVHKSYSNDRWMTGKFHTNSSLKLYEFSEVKYTILSKFKYKHEEFII